jgi:hypothetical protein
MTEPADWEVTIDPAEPLRMRVSDMRLISALTGKSWTDLFNGEDEADRLQVMVFWKLRQGNRDMGAAELWKIADDCEFVLEVDKTDPSGAAS